MTEIKLNQIEIFCMHNEPNLLVKCLFKSNHRTTKNIQIYNTKTVVPKEKSFMTNDVFKK